MKDERAQLLLATIAVLLAAHLFMPSSLVSSAQARDEAASTVLRARTIELVDERGLTRVSLRTEEDGTVVFRMMDAKGTIRVKLGASEDGSGLVLLNGNTEPGVHLLASREGQESRWQRRAKRLGCFNHDIRIPGIADDNPLPVLSLKQRNQFSRVHHRTRLVGDLVGLPLPS
jgi:hypothetical protein